MASNGNISGGSGKGGIICLIVVVVLVLALIGSCSGGSGKGNVYGDGKEQRCWYCGKVIVNSEGRAIHATGGKCDYCGKKNSY